MTRSTEEMFVAARNGDSVSLGRLLSMVEIGGPSARRVGELVFDNYRAAQIIGVTGAPGAGKSTLTSRLASAFRMRDKSVAIFAIDPSSTISGGAFLGDRLRMHEHINDSKVFIRSIATRGHLGGLPLATPEAIRLVETIGFDVILLETVGVGQIELDVAQLADTVVVVMNPGWGDDVQAAKSGLLEIADIFAVNKSDRPGVDQLLKELSYMLMLRQQPVGSWRIPLIRTVATRNEGIEELWTALNAHWSQQTSESLAASRSRRLWWGVCEIARTRVRDQQEVILQSDVGTSLRNQLETRQVSPWLAADLLLNELRALLAVQP